jgi:hypothetical protein
MTKEHDFEKTDEGTFINTNMDDFERYKAARARAYREKDLSTKVNKLEDDISQIKQLLQKLVG